MALYIYEQNSKLNEEAYYGPFSEEEIEQRLNDRFADLMASGLANLDAVEMTDEEAAKFYINSREFWMNQLADLEKD